MPPGRARVAQPFDLALLIQTGALPLGFSRGLTLHHICARADERVCVERVGGSVLSGSRNPARSGPLMRRLFGYAGSDTSQPCTTQFL